jgi:hypothetical protein
MELNESNRIVAAILAAGLLHHTREKFTQKDAAPDVFDAVTAYGQCLEQLYQRQQKPKMPGTMYY